MPHWIQYCFFFATMAFAHSCASAGTIPFREASCVNPSSCAAGLLSLLFLLTILMLCLVLSRQCLQYCVRLRGVQNFPRFVGGNRLLLARAIRRGGRNHN